MIIDYIQLNNFLSHSDSLIRIENGVNVIYGKNGAGKSSIVDGIRFALFGEKRGDRMVELIRSNTRECSVTMGFRLDEKYYEVFRSLTLGKSSITGRNSWIKLDGVMIAETAEGVTNEIQHGLRIPKDIFLNSVFVRQGEMDALISETPANREKLFSKIIGIDALSESAQSIKRIIGELKLEEARFSSLSDRIETMLRERENASSEMNHAKEELGALTESGSKAKELLEQAEKSRTNAMEQKAHFDALSRGVLDMQNKISFLEKELESAREKQKEISYPAEEKANIERDPLFLHRSDANRYFRLLDELSVLEMSMKNAKSAIDSYNEEKVKLTSLEEKHKRFTLLDGRVKELEEKIRPLQQFRTLTRKLEEEEKDEEQRVEKLAGIVSYPEFRELKGQDRNTIAEKIAEHERLLRKSESDRTGMKERVGNLNRQVSELRKNKNTLGDNQRCPVCGTELDDEHLSEIHGNYQKQELELMQQISEAAEEISRLNQSSKNREAQLIKLRRPEVEEYLRSADELSRLKESVSDKHERIAEMRKPLSELEKVEKDYDDIAREKDGLDGAEKEYNTIMYSLGRVPIEKYTEDARKLEGNAREIKRSVEALVAEMGFRPDTDDRDNLERLLNRHDVLLNMENAYRTLMNESEGITRSMSETMQDLDRIAKERDAMGDVSSEVGRALDNYNVRKSEYDNMSRAIATLSERVRMSISNIAKLDESLAELEAERKRIEKVKRASALLESIRTSFDRNGIQSLIRKDSSVSINNMTRNYLSSFNFDFDDIRIDENFDIKVINNGVEEPLDSLSGGERISLAIAARLAIAGYLTGRVSTIIMDEPTNFLDEDRRNNLKDIIKYSLKDENMIQQMIMITHHSELTSAADLSFEVVKENGVSRVISG